nr:ribonuclease H-like domain-containing protein [Tanacetum cinerariifolium]
MNTHRPQGTPQILPSFKEYTSSATYPEEVKDTLGTPMKVKPLDQMKLEDVDLDTCNHDIPFSSREVSSFDEPKPQPQPLPSFPSLDVSLGDERGPKPPIKPHSPDSYTMKVADILAIHTSSSPHVIEDDFFRERPSLPLKTKELEKGGLKKHTGLSI